MLCTFTSLFFFKSDEWLQSYDLKCINMYNLDRGCTSANVLSFPTFLNCFRPVWLINHPQLQIWPKSGFDGVKTAKFGYFTQFSIFSPKMRLRLTLNGQFHLIHNFPHLLPPKRLISGEIPKIFISGEGYIGKFFE